MSNPKVLIVEDDQFILKAMKLQFETASYLVKTASDGEEALNTLKSWTPSAVILDILMPGKNGFEVLKEIKSNPKLKGMPVIIASNLNQEKDINQGIDLSAAEYIVKSDLSLSDLVRQTTNYINKSTHGQQTLKQ